MTAVVPDINLEQMWEQAIPCEYGRPDPDCSNPAAWLVTHKGAQAGCSILYCEEHKNALLQHLDGACANCGKRHKKHTVNCNVCWKTHMRREDVIIREL